MLWSSELDIFVASLLFTHVQRFLNSTGFTCQYCRIVLLISQEHTSIQALFCAWFRSLFFFLVFEFIAIKTCTGVTSVDVQLCIAGSSTIGGIHLTSLARGLRVVRAAAISLVVDEFGAQAAWVHSEFRCTLPHFAGLLWSYGSTGVCVRAECA